MTKARQVKGTASKCLGEPSGRYVPEVAVERPGANDAFLLPSLVNGKPVPRKAPSLLASTVSAHSNLSRD